MFSTANVPPLVWLTAAQFSLYAASWCVCARLARDERAAAQRWAAFNLLAACGLVLASGRDDSRAWLAYTGSNLCFVFAFVTLYAGVRRFLLLPHAFRTKMTLATAGAAAAALVWLGPAVEHAAARVVITYGAMVAIVLNEASRSVRPLLAQFGRAGAALTIVPGSLVALMFGARAVQQALFPDVALEMHRATASNVEMLFGYLVLAALFNFGFLALLILRLLLRLRVLSRHDPLTGLLNRRALDEELAREWTRFVRSGRPLSVLALDIDHFKRINDRWGHAGGDDVLAEVARRLRGQARAGEPVARTGGEEFVAVLAGAEVGEATDAAERLRRTIAAEPVIAQGEPLAVRVSIGVACASPGDADVTALLARADAALYRAKREGRDCVRSAAADAALPLSVPG